MIGNCCYISIAQIDAEKGGLVHAVDVFTDHMAARIEPDRVIFRDHRRERVVINVFGAVCF